MARKKPDDVSIGKFDILATYTYAKALLDGLDDDKAKEKGMVAAIMGAKAKLGHAGGSHQEDYKADKQAAEKKKKTSITAESFDRQVADKMGVFFDDVFLPDSEEAGQGRVVLRRGEEGALGPGDLGCEDRRREVQRADFRLP